MKPDCQHVRELMDSYLSGELSVETNHGVLRHLGECHDCAAESQRRQRLRAVLAQTTAVAMDVDRVSARITQALDGEQRSWRRVARVAAVAAVLVAAVSLTLWTGRPVDAAAYDDSADDHVACALTFPPGVTYDATRAAQNLASPFEGIAEAVGLSHGAYDVIDAHMCPYRGRNYAHVVVRGHDGQTLSLFAERAERGALPAAPSTVLTGEALDVRTATRRGYQVSAVATRDHRLYLVADRPTDPPDVAHDLLRAAVGFIRGLEK